MPIEHYPKPFREFLGTKHEKILIGLEVVCQGLFSASLFSLSNRNLRRNLLALLQTSRVILYNLEELHLIELKDEEYFITELGKGVLKFVQ